MKDLQRLVRVITELKQRQYPLLELKGVNENSSKENIFFKYVKKGIVNSDDEAAELLYETKSDDDRYRMLKSRLKQKMLNHLYFLDFTSKSFSSETQAKQECLSLLHLGSIAKTTDELKIAKSLFHKAHILAERYELSREKISALEELYAIFSINCQPHVFDQMVAELKEARDLYNIEEEARELFFRYKMLLVKSVNSRKKNIDETVGVIKKLEKSWKKTKSANIFNYFYSMKLFYLEMVGQYDDAIPFIKEILSEKYEGEKLNAKRIDKSQLIYSLQYAYLKTRRYKEGFELAEQNRNLFDPSDTMWFDFNALNFLLAAHSRNYKMAFDLIGEVFENKKFMTLSRRKEAEWKLFNAYLHFAYTGNFFMRSFNFARFVEEIPVYNKDKEGYNVAVLILQFMFYSERGDVDDLASRRDALKRYMDNHFKENFSYRTRTFFKLLNIVTENKLNVKKINQKSKYLLNKLQENQVVGSSYQEIEIIPYEHLWELLINLLKYEKTVIY